jgi:hypothetical protein
VGPDAHGSSVGDRDLVCAAMMIEHAGTLGLATIERLTDEFLGATRRRLPQFAPDAP